jgi:uncharacterized YccA/Bax inhibitor family protein
MSQEGTVRKALVCLLVLVLGAYFGLSGMLDAVAVTLALILGLVILLRRVTNPFVVLLFSAVIGFAVGGIAGSLQQRFYPSIAGNALVVTLGASCLLVSCYGMKFVRVTPVGLRIFGIVLIGHLVCIMAGAALMLMGALDHAGLMRTVAFALFSILGLMGAWLAAYSLLMDFDWIRKGVASHLPAPWEWHGAFRPIGSYVWFYLEILITIQFSAALMASIFG